MRQDADLNAQYHLELVAAFVRGHYPESAILELGAEDLFRYGQAQGLRLHKFKRTMELPRVRKVLSLLKGFFAQGLLQDLLDLGSGRGTFLWPLLMDPALTGLQILATDHNPQRTLDLGALSRGGLCRLKVAQMDARALALADRSVDAVTALEILEHMEEPERALREMVRVGRRLVVLSVPAHEDDNPEHLHLFDKETLVSLCKKVGLLRIQQHSVLNHIILCGAIP